MKRNLISGQYHLLPFHVCGKILVLFLMGGIRAIFEGESTTFLVNDLSYAQHSENFVFLVRKGGG